MVGKRNMPIPKGGFYPTVGMLSSCERVRVDLHPVTGWPWRPLLVVICVSVLVGSAQFDSQPHGVVARWIGSLLIRCWTVCFIRRVRGENHLLFINGFCDTQWWMYSFYCGPVLLKKKTDVWKRDHRTAFSVPFWMCNCDSLSISRKGNTSPLMFSSCLLSFQWNVFEYCFSLQRNLHWRRTWKQWCFHHCLYK